MKQSNTFIRGDRVKYIKPRYGDSISNPLWGGSYGHVAGTVTEVWGRLVRITWDSGYTSTYLTDVLNHLPEKRLTNPNFLFKRTKQNNYVEEN